MTIRVLLVEDHRLVREALAQALGQDDGIEVVGQAGDAASAFELAGRLAPDVVLLDINLPDGSGIELCERLMQDRPAVRIVALTAHADRQYVNGMLRAGAAAYVTKSAAGVELTMAVRAVAQGGSYLCSDVAQAMRSDVRAAAAGDEAPRLGRREVEVLRMLADGHRSPAIAERLHISVSTVEVHRRNIMQKLDLHSVAELTRYAVREGIVAP